MPHRRTVKKAASAGTFDEVVRYFPTNTARILSDQAEIEARELQEKRDIHALLFERAWRLEENDRRAR